MLLQRKTIVGNLKINYGLMEEMDFGLPKVLVDNSSAVEGFVLKQNQFMTKRSRRNY
jgi:hypothetical protein